MERYDRKLKDSDMQRYEEFNRRNALGNPIILKEAPTKPDDLKPNTLARHGNDLYIRDAQGILTKYSGTQIEE